MRFDASALPMEVKIMNKDKVVYSDQFKIDADGQGEITH